MTDNGSANEAGDIGRVTKYDGDGALATTVRDLVGTKHPVIGAATITPRGVTAATLGTGLEADFEIGSIAKGVTGLLYADAVDRREVEPSTTLGDLLPLGSAPAGQITLASLATHHSGLPRLAPGSKPLRRTIDLWRHGTNPYGETFEELMGQARHVKPGKPRAAYSNLGYMLLGHAVARAAGMAYAGLVAERIAKPLSLTTTRPPHPTTSAPRLSPARTGRDAHSCHGRARRSARPAASVPRSTPWPG